MVKYHMPLNNFYYSILNLDPQLHIVDSETFISIEPADMQPFM